MKLIFWVIVGLAGLTLFVLVPAQVQRMTKAENNPPEEGCVFLGNARDLTTVFFYDCNGEIKMKRIK